MEPAGFRHVDCQHQQQHCDAHHHHHHNYHHRQPNSEQQQQRLGHQTDNTNTTTRGVGSQVFFHYEHMPTKTSPTSSTSSSSSLSSSSASSPSSSLSWSRRSSPWHSNTVTPCKPTTTRTKKKKKSKSPRAHCCSRCYWLSLVSSASMRDALLVLAVVALASMTITFHLGHHLHPVQQDPALVVGVQQRQANDRRRGASPSPGSGRNGGENHLNIHRSLQRSDLSIRLKQKLSGVGNSAGGLVGTNLQVAAGGGGGGTGRGGDVVQQGAGVGNTLGVSDQFTNVLRVLQEHENATTAASDGGRVRVVVAGSNPQLGQDALLVESALRKHSAKVTHIALEDGAEDMSGTLQASHLGRWSVLLCLNTSAHADACVVSAVTTPSSLRPHQKINVIPGIQDLLRQPEVLCLQSGRHGQGRWLNTNLRCANLSGVNKDVSDNHSLCERHPLLLWPSQSAATMQLSVCSKTTDRLRGGIALELPANPLTWEATDKANNRKEDHPSNAAVPDLTEGEMKRPLRDSASSDWRKALTWRFPVLVTSLSPLRVYMHSEGVAWDSLESYVQQKPQRGLSLLELQQMAADHHGDGVAAATVAHLEESVMNILVRWEHLSHLPARSNTTSWCQRCFQLLEVTVIFNTTFHPVVVGIGASSLSGRLSSLSEYLIRQTSFNDLAAILTERRNVSVDLAKAFVDMGLSSVVQGKVCNADEKFCLGPRELVYLLDSLREQQTVKTGWKTVYPSPSAVRFTGLLKAGRSSTASATTTVTPKEVRPPMNTGQLHSFLLGLESFFIRTSEGGQSESFEDLNVPIDQSIQQQNGSHAGGEAPKARAETDVTLTGPPCSEDQGSMPYLSGVVTRPVLKLQPEFSPLKTDYQAEVPQNVQLVTVWAWSQSCHSQARLEDKKNTDKSANFTLGLGANTLRIFVVDMTHDEPWVVNTYTLTVTRRETYRDLGHFRPGLPHVICSIKQDCSLPYARREPCGLRQVTEESSWSKFLAQRSRLPTCTSGDIPGEWHVPCTRCSDDGAQCYWKEAVWSPTSCQEPRLPQAQLQTCFKHKKVLFIGDSTNRGIAHYMSQRVNGSLWEYPDKTHHLRLYSPINHGTTSFAFAYYPQFWLPAMHRPVFGKALYQVIRRTLPLDNSSSTVVVVGGVHWLATHHLKVVRTVLSRTGLSGAQVIVKGLGAGFHQPVSGVHQLSRNEHEKLLRHNQQVLSFARQEGMHVVDTFNITMARYSHFLQGRCACHFHRIAPEKHAGSGEDPEPFTTYSVEGDINAAYAEMVINRICLPS